MKKLFCDLCEKEIDHKAPGYSGSHSIHPVSAALKFTPIPREVPDGFPNHRFVMTAPSSKSIRVELRVLLDPVWNPEDPAGPEGERVDYENDDGDYCWSCLCGIVGVPRHTGPE